MTGRPSDLRTRAIVGIALICVAVAALLMGHILFWVLASVAGVLMQGEWGSLIGAGARARRLAMPRWIRPCARCHWKRRSAREIDIPVQLQLSERWPGRSRHGALR